MSMSILELRSWVIVGTCLTLWNCKYNTYLVPSEAIAADMPLPAMRCRQKNSKNLHSACHCPLSSGIAHMVTCITPAYAKWIRWTNDKMLITKHFRLQYGGPILSSYGTSSLHIRIFHSCKPRTRSPAALPCPTISKEDS